MIVELRHLININKDHSNFPVCMLGAMAALKYLQESANTDAKPIQSASKGEIDEMIAWLDNAIMRWSNSEGASMSALHTALVESETKKSLAQMVCELRETQSKLRRCLAFFASCIKSGEAWSLVCEEEYNGVKEKQT